MTELTRYWCSEENQETMFQAHAAFHATINTLKHWDRRLSQWFKGYLHPISQLLPCGYVPWQVADAGST